MDCQHEWESVTYQIGTVAGNKDRTTDFFTQRNNVNECQNSRKPTTDFCKKCNAWKGELGLEPNFNLYVEHLIVIFDEIRRVLKKTGCCFVNIGDTYFGGGNNRGNSKTLSKTQQGNRGAQGQVQQEWSLMDYSHKCMCMIPERFAIAMINSGWILRSKIIWHKPNAMPSSIKDRFGVDFEPVYFFTKSKKYIFNTLYEPITTSTKERVKYPRCNKDSKGASGQYAVKQLEYNNDYARGRIKRSVWRIPIKPCREAHFATFPTTLVEPMILSGSPEKGLVLDPFFGSGTTGLVAKQLGRNFIGLELNEEYVKIAESRIKPFLEQKTLGEKL